jgi:hypothetical protein
MTWPYLGRQPVWCPPRRRARHQGMTHRAVAAMVRTSPQPHPTGPERPPPPVPRRADRALANAAENGFGPDGVYMVSRGWNPQPEGGTSATSEPGNRPISWRSRMPTTPRPTVNGRLRLRAAHRLIVVAVAVLAFGMLAPSATASSAKPFHLSKTCDNTGCLVTASSFRRMPPGTTITYAGPSPDALVATIHAPHGTATGNCNIASVFATPSSPGRCVFDTGTGSLRRLQLDVAVTLDAAGVWHWDGTYRLNHRHHRRHHHH